MGSAKTMTIQTFVNDTRAGMPQKSTWDIVLHGLSILAVASYLVLYVLVPDAYAFGPALALLLALFGFRWKSLLIGVDRQSWFFVLVLLLYSIGQGLVLALHGEDISEFDLSIRYVAAVLVLLVVLKYPINAQWFFVLTAAGAVMASVHAVYQFEFQGARRVAGFDNPIHYGNGAMGLSLISFAGLIWATKQKPYFLWYGLFVLGFIGGIYASLVSGTRSGWIALPVVAVIGVYAYWRPLIQSKTILLFLIIAIVTAFTALSQIDLVERRANIAIDEFSDYFAEGRNDTSVGLRLDMWKAGLVAFQVNPLIGAGPSGTDRVVAELIASGSIHPAVDNFRHLHNQYIDAMARYGVIGLACYILLLLVPFMVFLRQSRSETASVSCLALGGAFFIGLHAVVNLTQSMLERNIGVMMFVFMVVFIWSALKSEEAKAKDMKDRESRDRSHNDAMD